MNIAGRSAVVTGGGNGIGRALAERFAAEGARGVTVADIDGEWARKVAERIGEQGIGVGCDVSDPDAISRLVSTAEDSFGPIDVFCSNAGRPPDDESTAPPDGGALTPLGIHAGMRLLMSGKALREMTEGKRRLYAALAGSVTRGEQRVLADAGHSTITTDHPDAVMQAIRDLLEEVRRGPTGA